MMPESELSRFINLVDSDEAFDIITDGNERWRFALLLNDEIVAIGAFHHRKELDSFMKAYDTLRNSNTGKWGSIVVQVTKD